MLNPSNYSSVQTHVSSNMGKYLPVMIMFKSTIQRVVISMLSSDELQDIRDCRLNMTVVDKLAYIGKAQYQHSEEQNDETLYCLCMALGTIIKEYDWGTKYIQQEGMCELAKKIASL